MTDDDSEKTISLRIKTEPCIRFSCQYAGACKSQKVACSSFAKYVRLNQVVPPTVPDRWGYRAIFGRCEQ